MYIFYIKPAKIFLASRIMLHEGQLKSKGEGVGVDQ